MKIDINNKEMGAKWVQHCIQTLQSNYGLNTGRSKNELLFTESLSRGSCHYYKLEAGLELFFFNKLKFNRNILPECKCTSQPGYFTLQIDYGNKIFNSKTTLGIQPCVYLAGSGTHPGSQSEKNKTVETVIINVSAKYLQQYNVQLSPIKDCKSYRWYDNINMQGFFDLRNVLYAKDMNNIIQRLKLTGIVLQLLSRFLTPAEAFKA